MAKRHSEHVQQVLNSAPKRTMREKMLSAAEAVGLTVNDSWDDDRLDAEIRKAAGTATQLNPNTSLEARED